MKTKSFKSKAELRAMVQPLQKLLKSKIGDKPFAVQMREYKAEEIALEEAKLERIFGTRK